MKMFLLSIALLAGSVNAAEIQLFNQTIFGHKKADSKFVVNKELGRAWVEITVDEYLGDPEADNSEEYRVQVPGLSFDAHTQTINLDIDGQIIECAAIVKKGISIFRHEIIKNTNCEFSAKTVKYTYDDGFELKKREKLQVFLITK